MNKAILLSAIASLGLGAVAAQAAVSLTHSLTVTNVYSTTGSSVQTNPTPAQLLADTTSGTTYIYRVAVNDSMTGLPSGQNFGDEIFNLTAAGNLQRLAANVGTARAQWLGNNPSDGFDNNGNSVATFQTNADKGPSSTDLQAITVVINNDANSYNNVYSDNAQTTPMADTRPAWGNPGPSKDGSIDVEFTGGPGETNGWLTLSGGQYATLDTNPADGSNYMTFGNTLLIPDGVLSGINPADPNGINPTAGSAAIEFVANVPEPASLSLLGLGALSLVARRRHA